jgi:hypothetical protein
MRIHYVTFRLIGLANFINLNKFYYLLYLPLRTCQNAGNRFFIILAFIKYYSIRIVKMRHNENGRAIRMHVRDDKYLQFFLVWGEPL